METKSKYKILIVDDDADVIDVIDSILKKAGYDVYSASNKKEGLAELGRVKPDLAILDVMMTSRFEGFEMAREMLDTPEYMDIPILIQSSIEVQETYNPNLREAAREMRRVPNFRALEVLLIRNSEDGTAGVDYKAEDGKSYWFRVKGFIRKPVDGKVIVPEIRKHLEE
ncbi:MAG: response regulator [Bacteroidales bacterium]|jgi:CheY-like chemotaxis protein|nr:response regulator [Bacteroidales bacterium]